MRFFPLSNPYLFSGFVLVARYGTVIAAEICSLLVAER